MLPAPIEHRFILEGQPYCLVEWDRGGERRFKAEYAIAIAAAPTVIDAIDGGNLYAEAVARECLREAPDLFWTTGPAPAQANGVRPRVVSFDHVPRALWEAFRKEVDTFIGLIFPPAPATAAPSVPASAGVAEHVAAPEAVSPLLRGRAE